MSNRRSSTKGQKPRQQTTSASAGPAIPIPKGLYGHRLEVANICAECGGELSHPKDGHFHTRRATASYGAEPFCCKHLATKCFIDPLAKPISYGVRYIADQKGDATAPITGTAIEDRFSNSEFSEEEDLSKTSQKNAKVAKAMKGQAAAKAKTNTNGKTPKTPRAPKAEYKYTPMAKNFSGNVVKVSVTGKEVSPVHLVEGEGATKCGYSTTEQSKGDKHYDLQFIESSGKVTCKRCLAEPKPAKEKKPTPISKAKGKKAKAAK